MDKLKLMSAIPSGFPPKPTSSDKTSVDTVSLPLDGSSFETIKPCTQNGISNRPREQLMGVAPQELTGTTFVEKMEYHTTETSKSTTFVHAPVGEYEPNTSVASRSITYTPEITAKGAAIASKELECKECYRLFNSELNLSRHVSVMHRIANFDCSTCGERFHTLAELGIHACPMSSISGVTPVYTCNTCTCVFGSLLDLNWHSCGNRVVHKPLLYFTCDRCPKRFSLQSDLKLHIRSKVFRCTDCDAGFGHKDQLLEHMRTHVLQRGASCSDCGFMFTQAVDLTTHTCIDDEFTCYVCGMMFEDTMDLPLHLLEHTRIDANRPHNFEFVSTAPYPNQTISYDSTDDDEGVLNANGKRARSRKTGSKELYERRTKEQSKKRSKPSQNPENDTKLRCDLCNKLCTTAQGLASHIRWHRKNEGATRKKRSSKHTDSDSDLECEVCGKAFLEDRSYRRHMAGHR